MADTPAPTKVKDKVSKKPLVLLRQLFWPILVGVSSIIVVLFVLVPQITQYLSTSKQLATNQTRLGVLQAKAKELEAIDPEVYSQNLKLLLQALPQEAEEPQAVLVVQDIVNKSNMTLEDIQIGGPGAKSGNSETSGNKGASQANISVTVTLLGSTTALQNFMKLANESPRVLQINVVDMQLSSVQTTLDSVEATVSMNVYYEAVKSQVGSVDAQLPQLTKDDQDFLLELAKRQQISNIDQSLKNVQSGKQNPFE
jgi:hypothetical protein